VPIRNENLKNRENYAVEFAKVSDRVNKYINPYLANQYLKNINMKPTFQNREKVLDMIYNPSSNEQPLRRLSQHLYNTQTPYKRLIHYFADMLTFDISIYPKNITDKQLQSDKFKKDYDKVWSWLEKFDYRREFKKVLLGMLLEDGKFTYLRTDGIGYTLQEMPSDFAMIDAWCEFGWLYSFDMLYFQQTGSNINGFAPEFKKYYKQVLDMKSNKVKYPTIRPESRNGQWMYWKEINPDNGWMFKFDYAFAGLVPPFLGLFLDAIDIDTYRQLQKDKAFLDVYKIIMGTVPRNKENKTGSKSDDFAIDANTLGNFVQLVKNSLPSQVDFKAVPLENLTSFSFENSSTNKDIVGTAMKNFYRNSGSDQALFNSEKPNASTMKASTRIDAAFVERIYSQFELFLEYHINKITNYKYDIQLKGTVFDENERLDTALTLAQNGIITPELPSAMHLTERQFRNGIMLMKEMGYPDMFTPIKTAYTLSKKDVESGRPTSKDVSDSGEITRDAGSNEEKK
jgi:hypothetical protein